MSRWLNGSLEHILTPSPEDTFRRLPALDGSLPMSAFEAPRAAPSQAAIERFLDDVAHDDLGLTIALIGLERQLGAMPYDRSIRAAAETLRERVADLCELRDALHDVYIVADDPRIAHLLAPEAPLAAFVRGVYVWCAIVTDALQELAVSLHTMTPDWAQVRSKIDEGTSFYFDGLVLSIRRDVALARIHPRDLADPLHTFEGDVEALLWAASWLSASLQKRFG
jgi:hypothetical protein